MAAVSSEKMNGFPENQRESIVISGLSGRFPECDNVEEFKQQLLNGIDMITDDPRRWPSGLNGLPKRFGKSKNSKHFDAQYFGVHAKQADQSDPQIRLLLEVTHEAITDAGYNPNELRGTKCGVFMGICSSDSSEYWERKADEINGYGLTGCSRSMFSNRISYAFDFKGPSFTIDTACSSGLYAFAQAVNAIRSGECDSAIVGGANLLLKPNGCLHFERLGMINQEGACKSFDASGNGYVRSEAVSAIFLQKEDVARRIYASVSGSKTNSDGYKDLGITYPSGNMQLQLIKDTYAETGIDPTKIEFVEAHGTGTKVGDPQELNAITEFFCENRKDPSLIGSVKSNMGHAEAASAICSIAKLVIAMETGFIPANLHYQNPNPEIPALSDGRLKVLTENQPWNGGMVAINSFGFGGSNAHVILQSNPKSKPKPSTTNIPRVVEVSGRTEEAVEVLLEAAENNRNDEEFLCLSDQIHKYPITGHNFRGYRVLGSSNMKEINQLTSGRRPVWFVYPGVGSQWPAMGKDFMAIEMFRKSIEITANVLRPYGIDLVDLIENGTEESFENIVNTYAAITAMQIALTDMLKLSKIEPEGIIGHSFGEVVCGYADGCLTAEQALLSNLVRASAVLNSDSPPGLMASVGISWKEAKERCPPSVYPACHNSQDNVTVSGDPKEMKRFMAELLSEDVFVREVESTGYAFHCRRIAKAAPILQKSLEKIITDPKPRSSKWISTSVPQSSWDDTSAQICSPEYFVNNLLSPVSFQEAIELIPKNASVIEIAPSGLFQGILKRSIGSDCATISLAKKGHNDNVNFFLSAVGKIYAAGSQPCSSASYKMPSFPVGRGTPMISPHIKWDHSTDWTVASFIDEEEQSGEFLVEIDSTKEENKFLLGHKSDGRIIYPGAGYLFHVWKTSAKIRNQEYENMPVIFEDIQSHKAIISSKEETVKFFINIFMGSGAFELREGGSSVVSGKIRIPENIDKETIDIWNKNSTPDTGLPLSKEDIYKDLLMRGYEYVDSFRGIVKSDNRGYQGEILCQENWICFIDTVLQFTIIGNNTRELFLPTKLQKVIIDPIAQKKAMKSSNSDVLPITFDQDIGVVKCGGIEGRAMTSSIAPRRLNHKQPILEKYQFIPYDTTKLTNYKLSKTEILTIFSHILIENSTGAKNFKMSEVILDGSVESSLSPISKSVFEREPLISVESTVVTFNPVNSTFLEERDIKHGTTLEENMDVVVCHDLLSRNDLGTLKTISSSIGEGSFILLEESEVNLNSIDFTSIDLQTISSHIAGNTYILLRKVAHETTDHVIKISLADFSYLESLKNAMGGAEEKGTKVYLYSDEKLSGVIGMVNGLRKEPQGQNIRSIFIQDKTSKPFSINDYSDQLKKDLVHNVSKGGVWGCYRHLMMEDVGESHEKRVTHAVINTSTRGDSSSLRWIEGPLSKNSSDFESCHVYYASLNFRDIMIATGKLPPDALPGKLNGEENLLGLEYAGRNAKGERLMGLVQYRSSATTVSIDPDLCWKVPENWTLEEAATIPVVYATAYYALIVRGQSQPGESVSIHAGSGGVGIASISIALYMGCEVFTTVSSKIKRDFSKSTFPDLSDENIGYSRDSSFEQFILSRTHGRGVDAVLNSLAGDQLKASLRCLASNGKFLEIGKVDLSNNSALGMSVFSKNISFHGILLDAIVSDSSPHTKRLLVKLVEEGIRNGAVRPLPATVFREDQIEEAFRYMAAGKHIGKVVIKIREEEPQKQCVPKPKVVTAIPKTYMDPNKSYILVGGLGGFGLELTNWSVRRGATKLVLSSRTGVKTGYQSLCSRKWREKGIEVEVSTEDVSTEIGARRLIEQAKSLGPVGGIFNLAAVLRDGMMKNQTEEKFRICCQPKIAATIHLDKVSRETTKDSDHFVTFSSLACGRGNAGQSNYAFANSVMERICENRRESGLAGLAIQWGAIGDVGSAFELLGSNDIEIAGTSPQRMTSCLATSDIFSGLKNHTVSSFVLADSKETKTNDSKCKLVDSIANILGSKDTNNWPPNTTLAELGMDSLMAAEIKHTLERNFDIDLSTAAIRALTLNKLIEYETNPKPTNDSNNKTSSEKKQRLTIKNIEVVPKETIVKISKEDKNNNKTPLFIIHPIEGNIEVLVGMARQINAPVFGSQCTPDAPSDSIENLAEFYLDHIRIVQPSGPYTIVGYSFGAGVAFEIGIQLENIGEEVKLWLIDGSPSYVSVHSVRERANKSIEKGNLDAEQSGALVIFMQLFDDIDEKKIFADLLTLSSWEERLATSMKILAEITSIPEAELALAASCYFKRIQAADNYKPSKKFRGEVCLLRATGNDLYLGEDYGLSKVCERKVRIDNVEGNHTSILTGVTAQKIANMSQPNSPSM